MVRTTTMVKEIIAMNAQVQRRTHESMAKHFLVSFIITIKDTYINQITNEPTSTSIETPISEVIKRLILNLLE